MKNKFLKTTPLLLVALLAVAGCKNDQGTSGSASEGGSSSSDSSGSYEQLELDEYKSYVKYDLANVKSSIGELTDSAVKTAVDKAYNDGVAAIEGATSVSAVTTAFETAKTNMAQAIPVANGAYSFVSKTNAEKTEILGLLEAYAVRNGITGISLFENGGYVMYSDRITLGTEKYITGYGFGVLSEGKITADMASESNAAWKRYYHTYNLADPGTANYLNDKGSEVADFYSYIAGSYFTTFMNETKNGYDWVPELANEKPVALNADASGMATKWRFSVKTSEVKYTTNSTIPSRAAFNNRPVELEDYLTPFKLLLTKSNAYVRGAEMANTTTGAIVGAKEYYEATSTGVDEEKFKNVGLKVYEEGGKSYFEYEFTTPQTPFYAMYYITSNLYQPIPQEFLDLVTPKYYLGYNETKTETPVDNSLSLGSYALERWDSGQQVVYKKNPNYVYADTKYAIPGVHINILTAASTDQEAGLKEFLAGKIDSSGIPQTRLDEFRNDPRTRTTTGDSNFKLNVNATDQKTWEYLFGENGVVSQTPKDKYWQVEPALSNQHFVKALSLSIDRKTFSEARGSIPSVDYLSSNYMSDPENGISYSTTKAHQDAVKELLENTDGYGYNLELAREYFKVALAELEASGAYTPGTKANPTVINLQIAWMYPTHEDAYHKEIKQYLETAFNDVSVSDGKYKLTVDFWVGAEWDDVYYDKLMVGQYDLGFGSISGNSLNPLDFMSVLSSDQNISGNFTLNWGTNTNDVDADILVYDGKRWSYDALWTAANATAVVVDGQNVAAATASLVSHEENLDGTYTSVVEVNVANPEFVSVDVTDVVVCSYADSENYYEESILSASEVVVDEATGKVTITITSSKDIVTRYPGPVGFDVYYNLTIEDSVSASYSSVYAEFPTPAA